MNSLKKQKVNIKRISQMAMLFALAVVLMFVESAIPPIPTLPPGVKLGLSNIVVMYCLFFMGNKQAVVILFLKSFFVLLTRGVVAFFMSLSGGIFSILIMILLLSLKKRKISYIIISVFAAIAHNIGQLLVSGILLMNTMVLFYLPILIISGVFMGIITGTILKVMIPAMKRVQGKDD